MTDRRDWDQSPQYPQPGYGQQRPQGQPWRPQEYNRNARQQRPQAPEQQPGPTQGRPQYPGQPPSHRHQSWPPATSF